MRSTSSKSLVVLACLVVASHARADFDGEVVGVLDGDTVDVLVATKPIRVRLANIDAPEKAQAYGARSRQALADLVFRRVVHVQEHGADRYGRAIGDITADGRSINRTMIALGMAWAYRKYLTDSTLLDVEASARAGRVGLWADPQPVPPWEWRRAKRAGEG